MKNINKETLSFIKNKGMVNDIKWLISVIPKYFGDCKYELELWTIDENSLNLRIYGDIIPSEFRRLRRAICEEILEKGYNKLYELICVFQRNISE